MHKYLEIGKISIKTQVTYRFDVFLGSLIPFIRVFLAFFLWRTLFNGKNEIGGMSFSMVLTYYIICSFIQRLDQSNGMVWDFAGEIREGRFSKYLVKPISPLGHFVSICLGKTLYILFFTLIAVVFVAFIFKGNFLFPSSVLNLMLSIFIAFLGLIFMILLNYLTALLAFKFTDITGWHLLKGNIVEFLSGALIPLSVLPLWMLNVMKIFPFYYMQFLPASLYLGLRTEEAYTGILIMLIWIFTIWFLAETTYNRFRRLYEGVGA